MDFYWTGSAAGAKILSIICNQGPISRAALCRITKQARSTMSLQVEQLLQLGLIEEKPIDTDSKAQARTLLKLSEKPGVFLAVFLGLTHFKVALCRTDTTIINFKIERGNMTDGPINILQKVHICITGLLSDENLTQDKIIGLGIALPGPIDYRKGMVSSPLGVVSTWHNYPLKTVLHNQYGCPVIVDNDVHAMALGEQHRGSAKNNNDFIMVKLATGIGASIVADGKLYRGSKGAAGFISHNQVEGNSTPCICGKQGCLEVVAGGAAIARQGMEAIYAGKSPILAQLLQSKPELSEEDRLPQIAKQLPELLSRNIGRVTASDIAIAANMGDSVSFEILQRSARAIGSIMAHQINFNNPSLVILAGPLTKLGDKYLSTIRQVILEKAMPLMTVDLEIKTSQLDDMQGLIGTCLLAQSEYFSFDKIRKQLDANKLRVTKKSN
ncbi:ROK family transcriptional regulator [Psychromonas sp. SA13A]|uniref:ROK family transcriptional regulator n=1 Tax=Psychromonas sp. SA13A TaxID=2686346 RepID=UPI00140E418B|nr:ROK family transcriptional regulator [Psychromonas sp. SA13A]